MPEASRNNDGVNAAIRCVAFDAVGTLIRAQPPAGEVYAAVARRHGSRRSAAEIAARFRQAFVDSEQRDCAAHAGAGLATDEARELRRWREIVAGVIDDIDRPGDCFDELYGHFARPESWQCYDDVAGTLAELRQSGIELAVASNFDHRLHPVCDGIPALRGISKRIISSEVGWRKPSPRFYESLLRIAGCPAGEIVMVGDDFQNDVAGAREAGLQAIYLNRRSIVAPGEISSLLQLLPWLRQSGLVPG